MLQDKYNRLIIDKLPKEVAIEFKQIKDDTDNFSDEDVMEIYTENFNDLFKIVEDKYPEALKAKKKLIKTAKAKIVKPATEKKKVVKKAEPKKKLVKKAKKVDELPCDDAKKELKKIESKKAQAVKKRAEAPKKKVSTAAREKQVKALSSLFKTSDFKENPLAAKKFAKQIVAVYKDSADVSKALSEQLQTDIDALIESKYNNFEKMEGGGQLQGDVESEINKLYKKSGFINNDFSWQGKLLEMIQDNSIEAYKIYKSLSKAQKEDVLQYQFEFDNDMGADGDGEIETSKENLEIMLEDAKNGKTY